MAGTLNGTIPELPNPQGKACRVAPALTRQTVNRRIREQPPALIFTCFSGKSGIGTWPPFVPASADAIPSGRLPWLHRASPSTTLDKSQRNLVFPQLTVNRQK